MVLANHEKRKLDCRHLATAGPDKQHIIDPAITRVTRPKTRTRPHIVGVGVHIFTAGKSAHDIGRAMAIADIDNLNNCTVVGAKGITGIQIYRPVIAHRLPVRTNDEDRAIDAFATNRAANDLDDTARPTYSLPEFVNVRQFHGEIAKWSRTGVSTLPSCTSLAPDMNRRGHRRNLTSTKKIKFGRNMTVLIAGGGIVGLSLALTCQQIGVALLV